MNFVITSRAMPAGKRPIHLAELVTCLRAIGVEPKKVKGQGYKRYFTANDRNGGESESHLWDLFEQAKRLWLAGVRRLHPDTGGDASACAQWNALWLRIKELFARKGIGI